MLKVDNMQFQIVKLSTEMEIIRNSQIEMLQIKKQIKNTFNKLISRQYHQERISEAEDRLIETSLKHKWKKELTI